MYRFTLREPLTAYCEALKGILFVNKWLLVNDGTITISSGYSWDGCTFGINTKKTYIASCVHDACYQFKIDKAKSDAAFLKLLQQNGFRFAKVYYFAVKLFGWIFY